MKLIPIRQPNRHYHEQLLTFFKNYNIDHITIFEFGSNDMVNAKFSSKTILQQMVSKQLQHIRLHMLDIDLLDHILSQ